MNASGTLLVVSGIACIALCAFAMHTLMPREGKPPSAWLGTETRSTIVTLSLLVLFVFGIGLFVRGVFS